MKLENELAREMRQHYLFSALSEVQRTRLAKHMQLRRFVANEPLFSQGGPAEHFFLLRAGTVKLYRLSYEGREKIMRLIHPPQTFAESMMFMAEPRYLVHADSIEPGSLVSIECSAFLDILQESFATCLAVMAQMTQRIQAHWDEIEALTLKNSRYRVVHYLLSLVPQSAQGRIAMTLPVRKMLIAAELAVTPETLSRTLRALSDKGLIEIEEERLTLLDIEALRRSLR